MQACKEEACAAQGLVCRPRRGGGDGKEAEQRAEEGGAEEEEVCWEESMVQLGRGRGGAVRRRKCGARGRSSVKSRGLSVEESTRLAGGFGEDREQ
mmetsp:Transcript_48139/g.114042  ORF Transcript_48139/g.114042 Transcript_48139/m.114042 type:complete len:96 (-) Transcript_48139:18-305(-)